VAGTLHTVDGRSVLRFERRLPHPVEKVWRAITEPAHLGHWFPAEMRMDLAPGAPIHFAFREGEGPATEGTIVELDPPRVFAFTWDRDLLRWELRPEGQGSLLVFTHTFDDRAGAASIASGWEGCLEALGEVLDGRPVDLPDRWAERHEAYVERFGLSEGSLRQSADGWTVRFERQMTKPVDAVWAALAGAADPAGVPAAGLAAGSPAPSRFTTEAVPAGAITAVDPPAVLEYDWLLDGEPVGRVRWELSDGLGGARLVLTQGGPPALAERQSVALAAWRTHLELLADELRDGAHHR
jgi:uncharacterized protein YndB with AHSA1/START domain